MKSATWEHKAFNDLTLEELYGLLRLRSEAFHVEQDCAYLDLDNKDQNSYHLLGKSKKGELVAYARIIPPGVSFNEVSIGRVVTSHRTRGTGLGKMLMQKAIEAVYDKFGPVPVRIGAQCYLTRFYGFFGFLPDGEEYLEDNIPHIEMVLPPKKVKP
jgi:ElaA protein